MCEKLGTLAAITGLAGFFLLVLTISTQIPPQYKRIPTATWEIRKSVLVATVGILMLLLAIIMARAGI